MSLRQIETKRADRRNNVDVMVDVMAHIPYRSFNWPLARSAMVMPSAGR
jgi:hypothetical protein